MFRFFEYTIVRVHIIENQKKILADLESRLCPSSVELATAFRWKKFVNSELVLRIRRGSWCSESGQGELVLLVGRCLQTVGVGASSESVLINLEVGASSRLVPTKHCKRTILYIKANYFVVFSHIGFPRKSCVHVHNCLFENLKLSLNKEFKS